MKGQVSQYLLKVACQRLPLPWLNLCVSLYNCLSLLGTDSGTGVFQLILENLFEHLTEYIRTIVSERLVTTDTALIQSYYFSGENYSNFSHYIPYDDGEKFHDVKMKMGGFI